MERLLRWGNGFTYSNHPIIEPKTRPSTMKLIRYNYPELAFGPSLRRWLSETFDGVENFGGRLNRSAGAGSRLPVDLYASEAAYHVRMDLPGVPKETVQVSVENAILTVRAEHTEEGEGRSESFALVRSLAVPEDADSGAVSAKLENGVLAITLPKLEERKPRRITVE